jgi:hypothetical protein
MPMNDADRERYFKERKRIAEELGIQDKNDVILLDVAESTSWIEQTGLGGPKAPTLRAQARAAENREEGGE